MPLDRWFRGRQQAPVDQEVLTTLLAVNTGITRLAMDTHRITADFLEAHFITVTWVEGVQPVDQAWVISSGEAARRNADLFYEVQKVPNAAPFKTWRGAATRTLQHLFAQVEQLDKALTTTRGTLAERHSDLSIRAMNEANEELDNLSKASAALVQRDTAALLKLFTDQREAGILTDDEFAERAEILGRF